MDVGWGISSSGEHVRKQLQVGDGFKVVGALFLAKSAIEVGADADVQGISGNLANMIEVIDQYFKAALIFFRG